MFGGRTKGRIKTDENAAIEKTYLFNRFVIEMLLAHSQDATIATCIYIESVNCCLYVVSERVLNALNFSL